MTRTSPAAEPEAAPSPRAPIDDVAALAPGAAADAGTLRALEFAATVERLRGLTGFAPSAELATATLPVADAEHVRLLNDQTDEAAR
ncbi:MAG: DNA primase, partial [Candidatus Limnocylindria bacterium]